MVVELKKLVQFGLVSALTLTAGHALAADQVFTWSSGGNHQDTATVTLVDNDGEPQIRAAYTSYDTTEQDYLLDTKTSIILAHVYTPWDGSQNLTVVPQTHDLASKFSYIGVAYDMRKIVETVATSGGTVAPRPELQAALARLGASL